MREAAAQAGIRTFMVRDTASIEWLTAFDNVFDDEQAHALFSALRELDARGAKTVFARCPAQEGVAMAVYNRLLRAAAFRVVEV